jgi:diaminobutyrate-2-oxoglutarate transaminase
MALHAEEIVAHVLQLAAADPAAFVAAEAEFAKRRAAEGLFFEVDELTPVSLRPMPLARAEDAEIRGATMGLQALLDKMGEMYRGDPMVRACFPAYAAAERWMIPAHGVRPGTGVLRLDGLLTDGRFRIMEVSVGDCGGVIKAGIELSLWRESVVDLLGLQRPSFGDQPFGEDPLMFVRYLIDAHQQQFGKQPEAAAAVGLENQYLNEVALVLAGLQKLGVPARRFDATELRRGTGFGMVADNFAFSLAWQKLDQVRLVRTPEASDYLDALSAGEICTVPTLLAHCLLDDKSVLAFLSDPANASLFTSEENDIIARHIPWTRALRPGKCIAPDGSMADMMEFATKQQMHLVLKPNDRTRGEGVLIGPEIKPDDWQSELATAMRYGNHIVQEFIPLPEIDMPFGNPPRVMRMKHGIDSFAFGDKFAGYMCRASVDTIINVGRRGQHVPVAVEEPAGT